MIVRATILVVFAIRLIVLVVVGDEIVEGEAVMRGNEIDAGPGFSAPPVEVIAGTGDALGEIGELTLFAFPISAHGSDSADRGQKIRSNCTPNNS